MWVPGRALPAYCLAVWIHGAWLGPSAVRAGGPTVLSCLGVDGERAAPLLVTHQPKGKPGAVLFTLGSTDVGRHRESVSREYEIEGEVISELVRRSFRAAVRAIARPVVSVTKPASVLAFRRKDGKV